MKRNHKARLFSTILAFVAMLGFGNPSSQNAVKGSAAIVPNQVADVTTTVTHYELGGIYEGTLENLLDRNDDTYCWFHSPTANVSYIQLTFSEIITVYDVRVLFDKNDRMIGEVSYSTDGESFVSLLTVDKNEKFYSLENPVQAKYVRLTETDGNGGYWVKMFDFTVNSGRPHVNYDGFTYVVRDWNSENNMTDHDMNTYAWFDWRNEAGANITLRYDEVKEVRNIYLFASHPETSDHFQKMAFYYSLDGSSYTLVGEDCYVEQKEVLIQLSSPVQAKYIRVVCPEKQDMGFAIREFGINHEKEKAPITFSNNTPYTYTSEAITPTYTIPFLTEATIEYTSHSAFYSYEAPIKPGWYALVVTIPETAYYLETSEFAVFCIQDTKEHFISEWNLAMSKGVCDYASNTGDMANYEYLLEVYRDCMTNEVRDEVSNYRWSENSTILETMQYIEMLRSRSTSQTTSQTGSFIHSVRDTNAFVMMIIVMGFGLSLIGGYYLLNKKRSQ